MSKLSDDKGFSYIEVLVAAMVLGLALAPIVQSLAAPWIASSEEDYMILNTSRDKMEEVLSMDFTTIPESPPNALDDTVIIGGKSITRDVSVVLYDLNGDLIPETDAKMITVTVEHILLTALKVDP